jgi:glycosyltransferase involved in cell wall biosynthesis
LRRVARDSSLILTANAETKRILEAAGARNVKLFLDSGVEPDWLAPRPPDRPEKNTLLLHWSGRLEYRKALPLALEAVARVKDLSVRLVISGDGPLLRNMQDLAQRLGVSDRVNFTGFMPRTELLKHFQEADAFIFTSLQDCFGTVLLEAMGQALPLLTLNHQGVAAHIPDEAAIKVPVTSPSETVAALASGIRVLATNLELRRRMSQASWKFAAAQSWPGRVRQMTEWYTEILNSRRLDDAVSQVISRASHLPGIGG